jgi:hypothetical protein
MTPRKILLERVPVRKDTQGRVTERFFDKYGEPRFTPNTPEANRRALAMIRAVPSNKPKGGYRVRKKDRPKRERYHI